MANKSLLNLQRTAIRALCVTIRESENQRIRESENQRIRESENQRIRESENQVNQTN
ncbi:MAG: hypothetical protein AB8E15_04865 [Bdellovibrionales bacterium]